MSDAATRLPVGDHEDPPPSYDSLPPAALALTESYITAPSIILHVEGDPKHPDLSVLLPDRSRIYHLATESTLVYHETTIQDLIAPRSLFSIRRRPVEGASDGCWRYTINSRTSRQGNTGASGGVKILELDTDPGMLSQTKPWSTRLIFRNERTGDLDGLTLVVEGLSSKSLLAEVKYQGDTVARIADMGKSYPAFELQIFRLGLDPLLISICAYVLDDRLMKDKRRHRISFSSGVPGIGRGPGAGLAGAYALGTF